MRGIARFNPRTTNMKLLAILFWATLAAYALATFLDPEFPGILDIINFF